MYFGLIPLFHSLDRRASLCSICKLILMEIFPPPWNGFFCFNSFETRLQFVSQSVCENREVQKVLFSYSSPCTFKVIGTSVLDNTLLLHLLLHLPYNFYFSTKNPPVISDKNNFQFKLLMEVRCILCPQPPGRPQV